MDTEQRYRATALGKTLESQGRHQRWLARQIGVSESHLSRVIAGERPLPQSQAEQVARVLAIPLFLIFELSDESISLRKERAMT